MVIFNIALADFVMMSADAILKMTIKLSQLKIITGTHFTQIRRQMCLETYLIFMI